MKYILFILALEASISYATDYQKTFDCGETLFDLGGGVVEPFVGIDRFAGPLVFKAESATKPGGKLIFGKNLILSCDKQIDFVQDAILREYLADGTENARSCNENSKGALALSCPPEPKSYLVKNGCEQLSSNDMSDTFQSRIKEHSSKIKYENILREYRMLESYRQGSALEVFSKRYQEISKKCTGIIDPQTLSRIQYNLNAVIFNYQNKEIPGAVPIVGVK